MKQGIHLSTGRFFGVGGAGECVLGISQDLEVTEGYDHDSREWECPEWCDDLVPLTGAEKAEICDVMAGRWLRLKARVLSEPPKP